MFAKHFGFHRLFLPALCLCFAAVSSAADEFDTYFADIAILQLKPVQTELKVTDAQRANMNKHADWLKTQASGIESQVKTGKLSTADANKQMTTYIGTLKKKIIAELSATQLKRLREITLQRDGLLPLMNEKMGDRIGMTKAQLTKLRDAYVANDTKAKTIQTDAFKPIFDKYNKLTPKSEDEKKRLSDQMNKELDAAKKKVQPQLEAMGKSFAALVDTTLTQGQKDSFSALKGKPFDPK